MPQLLGLGQSLTHSGHDFKVVAITKDGCVLKNDQREITVPLHEAEKILDMQDNGVAAEPTASNGNG